jgi:hypothetical protein
MNKIFYTFLWYFLSLNLTFADWWILWNFAKDREKWEKVTDVAIKNWDIHLWDIPIMIKWAIDLFINIAWTVAIIFIIIWAYKILFWSLKNDKTKWKDTIIMAISWFALASLAWFIIKIIIDNLWKVSG